MNKYPERPLGEVISLDINGISVSPDSTYQIAGVYSFGRGLFLRGPIKGSETSYTRLNRLHEGRIVLSRLKAFEGAICLVNSEFDGSFLSPEFPTFSTSAETDKRYIDFLCQWPDFWESLSKGSKGLGARRERVSAERFLEIKAPLPDRDEQQRVGGKLDVLIGRVDAVHELHTRLSRMQGGLNESLIRRVSEEAVETSRLGELLTFERAPVTIEADFTYRTVGVRSFGKGFIHHPPTKGEDLSKLNYFQFRAGALALSNLMAWEGGITVTRPEDTLYIASNCFFSTYRSTTA